MSEDEKNKTIIKVDDKHNLLKSEHYIATEEFEGIIVSMLPAGRIGEEYKIEFADKVAIVSKIKHDDVFVLLEKMRNKERVKVIRESIFQILIKEVKLKL